LLPSKFDVDVTVHLPVESKRFVSVLYNPHTYHHANDVDNDAIIESTGVIDFNGSTLSGHSATAAALFNLLHPRKPDDEPDLLLPRGAKPINHYDNPSLFGSLDTTNVKLIQYPIYDEEDEVCT
jgi:hypothetical protein